MKLEQNQVWKQGNEYLRIVRLERLEVEFKRVQNLLRAEGERVCLSKKEFCRLLKGARLLAQDEVRALWLEAGEP